MPLIKGQPDGWRWAAWLQGERGQKRLAFLLKQAEVFQHFAPAAADQGKKCAAFFSTLALDVASV